MNRFKFRAYNKEKKEMEYGLIVYNWLCDYNEGSSNEDIHLMQCTGLKDKNDNLIYEGDIVKFHENEVILEQKGVVKWINKSCSFYAFGNSDNNSGMSILESGTKNDKEIIGNIYENPELLENKI